MSLKSGYLSSCYVNDENLINKDELSAENINDEKLRLNLLHWVQPNN